MNTTSTNTRKIATCATIVLAGTLVLSACSGGETIKGTEVSSSSSGTAQATERIRDLGFNTKTPQLKIAVPGRLIMVRG